MPIALEICSFFVLDSTLGTVVIRVDSQQHDLLKSVYKIYSALLVLLVSVWMHFKNFLSHHILGQSYQSSEDIQTTENSNINVLKT